MGRKENKLNMRGQKVRGQKRKLKKLLKNIEDITPLFDFVDEYEHFHIPCGWWISELKTSSKIKTEFCKKWLEKTQEIISSKPDNRKFCKVVASIVSPCFWNSQITIFYDEEYYNTFFDRSGPYQIWTPIESRSFAESRGISSELKENGYVEILNDDEDIFKCEIWLYGEIS